MFDVGGGELMLILLVILLLFGPKKIPEFAQMVGKGLRQFRKAQEDLTQQIRDISAEVAVTEKPPVDSHTYIPAVPKPPSIAPISTTSMQDVGNATEDFTDRGHQPDDEHNNSTTTRDSDQK